ncbi:hypothetical protein [Sphingobium sp.]|uniref:hypothetical protein n=1 Tax=Sphingobium sp. TaxID=1912891 RepID=UPI0026064A6A|nr:hypothetical protein [Sphingobium sp.]
MTFETEVHGRYEIKSGPLAGAWGANAFRQRVVVAKATGTTREEAIANLRSELERMDQADLSSRDSEGAPPASVYEVALARLLPDMPDSYIAMLRAHLTAPDHLISATKLAEAAGYAGYEGANLHYGKLGQRVADEVGFSPPRREDGTEIWTCAIARDTSLDTEYPDTSMLEALSRNMETQHFEWQMRPQVVQALRALGW